MKTRRITITLTILAAACLLGGGCSGWLEATSSSQISGAKLFSSREGFHEALSGVYVSMGDTYCYGASYTCFTNDLVAGPFMPQNAVSFTDFQNHKYNTVVTVPVLSQMWKTGYNVIANVNNILHELDARRDVVQDETEYRLMRGELLAIRAYLHFDMMRMFGLESWDGANAGKLTIPYVTAYTKEPTRQLSYSQTAELLNADVDEALSLLEIDPILGDVPESFDETVNADGFWNNRNKHLNVLAVRALKARILLWEKKYDEASAMALGVLDLALGKGVASWIDPIEQLNQADNSLRDWSFSCEHIFSLEIMDLYNLVGLYYFNMTTSGSNGIILSEEVVDALYHLHDVIGPDGNWLTMVSDIRGPALQLRYGSRGYEIYKFYSTSSSVFRNRMPMIRISEMLMIAAECALRNNDAQGAMDTINELHSHRGVDDPVAPVIWESEPWEALWREMCREFIGEGRMFYFLKRLRPRDITTSHAAELFPPRPEVLIYPYPSEETAYGHIQEL